MVVVFVTAHPALLPAAVANCVLIRRVRAVAAAGAENGEAAIRQIVSTVLLHLSTVLHNNAVAVKGLPHR